MFFSIIFKDIMGGGDFWLDVIFFFLFGPANFPAEMLLS